ncbi:cupin domain-containing protein [Saliphagus sp. GCM10025308]
MSGTPQIDVAGELGCEKMRPRLWYVGPGDEMSHHRQTEQEEVYFVVQGPGRISIDGTDRDVPEGTLLRIPPETPRQIFNDTADEHVWYVVGAPPSKTTVDPRTTNEAASGRYNDQNTDI